MQCKSNGCNGITSTCLNQTFSAIPKSQPRQSTL